MIFIDNEDELHKLIVSNNGTIHDFSQKIFSADIIKEKNAGKISKKVTENIRKSNKRQIEEKIANGPHILSNITITPNMHSSLSLPSPSQSLPRNLHLQSTSIFSNEANTTSSFSCSSTPYHKNQSSNNLKDTAHNAQTSIKEKTNVVHLNQEPPNVYQNSTLNKYQDSASSSSQSFSHNQFSPINKSATTSSFSCSSSTLFQQKPKRIYQNNTDSSSDSSSDSDSSSQNSRESEQNNVGKGIFLGLPNGISKH